MFEQITNDSLGFTRQVVAKNIDGTTVVVADLYATITNTDTTQAVNYNINIINKDVVGSNYEAVQVEVDNFKEEIKNKAIALGMIAL